MAEYLEIGSAPCEEKCPQVGIDDSGICRKVAGIYRDQLQRWADKQKLDVVLSLQKNEHDFGMCYYASCKLPNDATEKQWDDACKVESEGPTNWDDIAKEQLKIVWPEGLSETV